MTEEQKIDAYDKALDHLVQTRDDLRRAKTFHRNHPTHPDLERAKAAHALARAEYIKIAYTL